VPLPEDLDALRWRAADMAAVEALAGDLALPDLPSRVDRAR
jgi:hypothetical protein